MITSPVRLQPFASPSVAIHCSLIAVLFDGMCSDILTFSLDRSRIKLNCMFNHLDRYLFVKFLLLIFVELLQSFMFYHK